MSVRPGWFRRQFGETMTLTLYESCYPQSTLGVLAKSNDGRWFVRGILGDFVPSQIPERHQQKVDLGLFGKIGEIQIKAYH